MQLLNNYCKEKLQLILWWIVVNWLEMRCNCLSQDVVVSQYWIHIGGYIHFSNPCCDSLWRWHMLLSSTLEMTHASQLHIGDDTCFSAPHWRWHTLPSSALQSTLEVATLWDKQFYFISNAHGYNGKGS